MIPTHTAIPMNTGTTADTIIKIDIIEIDIIETSAINIGGITENRIITIATRDLTEIVTTGNGSDTISDTDKQ